MRNTQEMMTILVEYAKNDDRVRLATLEGSRTNKNISADSFQDYDISYFVTDMDSFKKNDRWLDFLGEPSILDLKADRKRI